MARPHAPSRPRAGALTVHEVATTARITVRTLHHWDAVGLLRPSGRTEAGYRLYAEADLLRLRQILLYRELGFPLEAIAKVLDAPQPDPRAALLSQRALLAEKVGRLSAMIAGVDAALARLEGGDEMSTDALFPDPQEFQPRAHAAEARERWGDTRSYEESARRTRGYRPEDWARLKAEAQDLHTRMARALGRGVDPQSAEAADLAEEARLHIDRWFYPCSLAMHLRLGEMYLADERFTQTYERVAEGLTAWLVEAIRANARRGGVSEGGWDEGGT